jgi:hypothetical protein
MKRYFVSAMFSNGWDVDAENEEEAIEQFCEEAEGVGVVEPDGDFRVVEPRLSARDVYVAILADAGHETEDVHLVQRVAY